MAPIDIDQASKVSHIGAPTELMAAHSMDPKEIDLASKVSYTGVPRELMGGPFNGPHTHRSSFKGISYRGPNRAKGSVSVSDTSGH